MQRLVVDERSGGGPGGREPVDGNPSQDLVVGPGVRVRPIMELLVDPGEEGDRAIVQGVADCLGFGGLFGEVAAAVAGPPVFEALETFGFAGGVQG